MLRLVGYSPSGIQWKMYNFLCIHQKVRKNENKSTRFSARRQLKSITKNKRVAAKAEVNNFFLNLEFTKLELFYKIKVHLMPKFDKSN